MALYADQSDTVEFKHPEYVEYASQVAVVKDIYDGTDTSVKYLSQAPRESITSFTERQDKATVKNFVKRATEAFVGMIFRKPIDAVGFGEKVNNVLSIINTKDTLNKFARDLTTSLIRDGKVYLAVDTPIGGGQPYVSILDRMSVINWKVDSSGKYTLLVAYELVQEDYGDFGLSIIEQWRVYKDGGIVDIWRKDEKGNLYLKDTIHTDFDYIPIIDLSLSDIPPLYDIAKLSIKHMNRTSFKDKYLDMSAIPVPLIWGAGGEDTTGTKPVYVIGVDEAFVFTGTKDESDFQWRELSGSSIVALQDDLSVIEEDITSGVIRAATSDSTTVKTATQAFYEAAESSNRVTVIANVVEIGLNKAVKFIADIVNEPIEVTARVIVNQDFNAISNGGDSARLLWEVYMSGALSTETFLTSLDSFELIDIGSVDDEVKRIEADTFKPKPKEMTDISKKAIDNNMLAIENQNSINK